MNLVPPPAPGNPGPGSKDESINPKSADHDEPYTFGRAEVVIHLLDLQAQIDLLKLRGLLLDRKLDRHIPKEDPDGL